MIYSRSSIGKYEHIPTENRASATESEQRFQNLELDYPQSPLFDNSVGVITVFFRQSPGSDASICEQLSLSGTAPPVIRSSPCPASRHHDKKSLHLFVGNPDIAAGGSSYDASSPFRTRLEAVAVPHRTHTRLPMRPALIRSGSRLARS